MDYAAIMQSMPQMGGTFNAVTRPNGLNPQSHAYSFPYSSDTLYLMPQLQPPPPPHHRNMSDPQAVAQASKQTEPKPRLAKDEVQLLENEFRHNPKPTSQRKREIAELLRVENPRINNWFQNRRAKQKQILRREADPKAAGDASPCASSPSDQQDDAMASEYYGAQDPSQTQQRASSAAFPGTERHHHHHQSGLCPPAADGSATHSASPSAEEYPSPKSLVFPPGAGHDLSSYAPVMDGFLTSHAHGSYASQAASSHQNGSVDGDHASSTHDFEQSLNIYVPFTTGADMEPMMAPVASYQSELLDADDLPDLSDLPDLPDLPELDKDFVLPTCESHERLSSPNSVQSPTLGIADLRFKSPPPPANIATRRNKGIPAMLNATALRGHPFGPKTGVDVGKRSDGAAAMRRIASATGLMPKRIQKTNLPSAPRSPLYFERNKDALMHSFQTAAASAAAAAAGSGPLALSHSTNVSPVMASETLASIQPGAAAATADASDDEQASSFAAGPQAFFGLEHTLSTPPGTPGVNGGLSSFLHHADHSVPMEASWAFLPQDEAQLTPSLGSFGSDDLSMLQSAPAYVVNSQPPTPSVNQTLSHSYFPVRLHGSNGGGGSSGGVMNHTEYTFPGESYMLPAASAKSSPGRSKGKQYQFTPNVTPQDFFASEK